MGTTHTWRILMMDKKGWSLTIYEENFVILAMSVYWIMY